MLRNFSSAFSGGGSGAAKSARAMRLLLGGLVVLNLIGAGMVLFPPGGSAEQLERELSTLQSQLVQKRALLDQTRKHAAAVERGRSDGDQFLNQYFLSRRAAYTAVVTELDTVAHGSAIKPRETSYDIQPIEGSDTLSMMVITANFEGTYPDLLKFVHAIDASPRLLIIDSLTAAPEQGSDLAAVSLKIDAFVREDTPESVAGTQAFASAPHPAADASAANMATGAR